jgi:hypothetical protein
MVLLEWLGPRDPKDRWAPLVLPVPQVQLDQRVTRESRGINKTMRPEAAFVGGLFHFKLGHEPDMPGRPNDVRSSDKTGRGQHAAKATRLTRNRVAFRDGQDRF